MPWLPMGVMNKWKWKKWKMELRPNTVTQFRRHYLCYLLYLSMHGTTKRFMCVCVCVCVWNCDTAARSRCWRRLRPRRRSHSVSSSQPLRPSADAVVNAASTATAALRSLDQLQFTLASVSQFSVHTIVRTIRAGFSHVKAPREAFSNGGPSYLRILKKSDKTKSIFFQV